MRRRGNAFYGDSGGGLTVPNNVDISQRTADGPGDTDWASKAMKMLRGSPELAGMPALQDEVMSKRLEDLLGDSNAGYDTTPQEDALLRQSQPEPDEYTEQAERMTRSMERSDAFKHSGQFSDPNMRREFVEGLAERLRGGDGNRMPVQPQEPEEKPFSSEKFWSNPEEMKRAGKMVRPAKL
jgi:hypothetical protein